MDDIIKEMNKLSLEKGDILVVKLPIETTVEEYDRIKNSLKHYLPKDVQVMIVSDNVDIGIIKNRTGKYWDLFRIE